MTTPEFTLYGYFRSSASARVRTVMELHNIPRKDISIHLLKAEQKTAEYTALNPAQTLPTLVVNEADGSQWALSQCIAIMEYLDERFGEASPVGYLLPRDLRARGIVRSFVDLIIGDLFPMLTMGTLNKVKARGVDAGEWALESSTQYLTALEAMIKTNSTSGKFCYGDSVTMADVALATQMGTVLRFCPDILPQFPAVAGVFKHISALPQFVAADWKHQHDTPAEFRE